VVVGHRDTGRLLDHWAAAAARLRERFVSEGFWCRILTEIDTGGFARTQ
jgi:hypothetical protein